MTCGQPLQDTHCFFPKYSGSTLPDSGNNCKSYLNYVAEQKIYYMRLNYL
uniref:Uncharacterized protein n=1 Tax=Lepeophtheirus salmonis TaxID=72036 RepID=A0A0K2V4V1_LEPSM